MNKYFSYDPFEGDINYHCSEKEAKAEALKLAEDYYDDCREWDGSFDEASISQIKSICYGVALGNIDLPTRPVNDDDGESLKENFSEIVESPVVVELEKSSKWIKCSEKAPPLIGEQSKPVLVWGDGYDYPQIGIWDEYDGWNAWGVTHWQPLPEPPED